MQETLPWLTGSAQWIFKDFTTPLRVENPVPRINQKGVIERDMTKKEAYYVFQSYWADVPMAHIYGHTWPIRWGEPNEQKMVKVYSNCETAELFVNGKSAGSKAPRQPGLPRRRPALDDPICSRQEPSPRRRQTRQHNRHRRDRVSLPDRDMGRTQTLKLTEKNRTGNKVTIEAKLYDDKGILCLDARNQVRFSLAGGGRLIDNLGTPSGSRVVQLYNGRAEITLENTLPARPSLAVSSAGIPSAFCTIT